MPVQFLTTRGVILFTIFDDCMKLLFWGSTASGSTSFEPWIDSVGSRSLKHSPPSREKVLEFQKHQQFPICLNPEDPDACNVYKDLKFPSEVYERINEYHVEKTEARTEESAS